MAHWTEASLADGTLLARWDDATAYDRIYHVDRQHSAASDENPGTAELPFATIGRAAVVLEPGQKVVIHAGIYRECVQPPRGGDGPERMIAYEAAPGEDVVIDGGETWQPDARPSQGWGEIESHGNAPIVWMADFPSGLFDDYNPFLVRNAYDYLAYYGKQTDIEWMKRVVQRRGMIFYQGVPLRQLALPGELARADGAFWVEEPGMRIHFRLPGDADPQGVTLEISAREQVFAPHQRGLGYLRVSGLTLRHAANGLPVPQRGALSTNRGHHWIVEDCTIEWANSVGMDIGCQHWLSSIPATIGCHVIRRNILRHIGLCGIAGAGGVRDTLIEDNLFEHIGHLGLEAMAEGGGIKFHFPQRVLLRGNIFRHLTVGGVWYDCDADNCRITNNVFADILTSAGGVYSEMNFALNLIDHNLFWDLRIPDGLPRELGGHASAIYADCNEKLVVAHNFFGRIEGDGVLFALGQNSRVHGGRTGLCRANKSYNNIFYACPHRVHLGRREENESDGNLFDHRNYSASFFIGYPHPPTYQTLAGWQEYFGLDLHSTQAEIEAEFDADTLTLRWQANGEWPVCQPVPAFDEVSLHPGPVDAVKRETLVNGEWMSAVFPLKV